MLRKSSILAAAAIIGLLVGLAGCGAKPAAPVEVEAEAGAFEIYRSSRFALSIQFPGDWTSEEDESGAVVKFNAPLQDASDAFSENLNIVVEDLGRKMSLKEYSQQQLARLQSEGLRTVMGLDIQLEDTTLAGLPGKQAFITMQVQGTRMDFHQIWTVKDRRAYILTFTCEPDRYADYEDIFGLMASSFKLGG